eukprot:3163816-Karenia_brevis.AAC.1
MAKAPQKSRPERPPYKAPPVSRAEWEKMVRAQGPPKPVEFKHPPAKANPPKPTGPVIDVGAEGKSTAYDMAGPRLSG